MTRTFDVVVIGGDADGLVAAIELAKAGSNVLVLEAAVELGGTFREVEIAPGFRVAPLAADAGHVAPELLRAAGLRASGTVKADPTLVALGEGEPLLLHRSAEQAAAGLMRFSVRDAQHWPAFTRRVSELAGFLGELYQRPPPRIDSGTVSEYVAIAGLGRKFRGLGRAGMIEMLRTLPMAVADWLDDEFESDRLKGALAALAVSHAALGPRSGGTAFTFLHRHVGAEQGVIGERLRLEEGACALVRALEQQARANGVTIETGVSVHRLRVRNDRISGVVTAGGEEMTCHSVLSSLEPRRTLLELLEPEHLDPELIQTVRNIRFRGVSTFVLLALDELPLVRAGAGGLLPNAALAGSLMIAPTVDYVERAYDAAKFGRCSEEPCVEIRFPSICQPGLAPEGRHVAVLRVQFTPYHLRASGEGGESDWGRIRDRVADRALALIERHIPGFASRVRERLVLTPVDLESAFGLREGALSQGEMTLDQILFMRPVAGWSQYAMPVPGLYLCGAGTHPGVGITGRSGQLAARRVLEGMPARRRA